MLLLRFARESVWRDCSDAAHMHTRWGPKRARLISRRLQQLEAMTALADLDFMPFESHDHGDGVVEVAIDDDLSLFVEYVTKRPQEDGPMNDTLVIFAVGTRSIRVL